MSIIDSESQYHQLVKPTKTTTTNYQLAIYNKQNVRIGIFIKKIKKSFRRKLKHFSLALHLNNTQYVLVMKTKLTFLSILFSILSTVNAQINIADSTVQIISYWDLNESHVYEITQITNSKEDDNTAKIDSISMKAKVTVTDSTATSYIVTWEFSDYNMRESVFSPRLEMLLKARKIIYKTNELGVFEDLLNWEEVRDNLIARTKESIAIVGGEYDSDEFRENMDKVMSSTLQTISSKEYILNKEIEPVQLFHTFMGSAFKLGEIIESEIQTPNNYFPEKPFNAKVTLYLDTIATEDNYSVIRYEQMVDQEQLTTAARAFIAQMAESMGQEIDLDEAINERQLEHKSSVAAAIDNWGWPLYIESRTKVKFDSNEKTVTMTIQIIE